MTFNGTQGVRVPHFPVYSEVRHLLPVWSGRAREHVTGLQRTINGLMGSPSKPVDWTDPPAWIPERLTAGDRDLAQAIWNGSAHEVNPRYTYGHWLLVRTYGLLDEDGGVLRLTEDGSDFLQHQLGTTEFSIDKDEGLIKLLSIVKEEGPSRSGRLVNEWANYLSERSPFKTKSTIKDSMRRRLNNLLERKLVTRERNLYSVTKAGLHYLPGNESQDDGGDTREQLLALIRTHDKAVRQNLSDLLQRMDPFEFEHLVKRLLEAMDYENVKVTSRSGDGGVDVVGDIELGITSVREVVQVKRHNNAVQRKSLDALRGSLYRFNAVRGTIVTTSRFAKGARDAAFDGGVAPITLIDGEKLVELLVEHDIGVRKSMIEVFELDPSDIAVIGDED